MAADGEAEVVADGLELDEMEEQSGLLPSLQTLLQ